MRSDVRVIAATNRNLSQRVREGQFREDLYHRVAVVTITLPPLRDRKADIPRIADVLMAQINKDFGKDPGFQHKRISDAAMAFVKKYSWPGNVRQLSNALLQAAVMSDGPELHRDDIIAAVESAPESSSNQDPFERPLGEGFALEEHLTNIQKHYLRRAMEESRGVKTEAARLLGITNYQTLDAQLKRLDVKGNWK